MKLTANIFRAGKTIQDTWKQDYRKYTIPTDICGKVFPRDLCGNVFPRDLCGKVFPTDLCGKVSLTDLCGNFFPTNQGMNVLLSRYIPTLALMNTFNNPATRQDEELLLATVENSCLLGPISIPTR